MKLIMNSTTISYLYSSLTIVLAFTVYYGDTYFHNRFILN